MPDRRWWEHVNKGRDGGGAAGLVAADASADEPVGRYWLVGTSTGMLHVLSMDDLKPASGGTRSVGVEIGTSDGVTSMAVLCPGTGDRGTDNRADTNIEGARSSAAIGSAALCVGFANGAVRHYSLIKLLHAAIGDEHFPERLREALLEPMDVV